VQCTPGTSIGHKVKILGDSHLRRTASKIDQYLNTKFEVCSWIKPGANTTEMVNTLVKDLKCLGTQDVIVINGGSNDIGSKRNQTHNVLVHMTQFIQKYFTPHGMHLNIQGKEWLSKQIATQIHGLAESNSKDTPIIALKWKIEPISKQNSAKPLLEQIITSHKS
jgi:23S rRNA pseudoU1915 N3-methylase RlmH